jgi:serine/threonine protein kinase
MMLFLAHMHTLGVTHMDVKPENIMFDSEGAHGVLKMLDYGSSVFVQPHEMVSPIQTLFKPYACPI